MTMTLAQMEKRLDHLEQALRRLQQSEGQTPRNARWWLEHAGEFEGDSVYQEIVRRGRAYRRSLRTSEHKRDRKRTR